MALFHKEKWIIWLWICSMLSYTSEVSGDCSDGHLTPGGGAALANSGLTYGCHNGCPTTGHQVHIIAQTGGDPSVLSSGRYTWPKVTIHIKDKCTPKIPMILILIYHDVIYWEIEYGQSLQLTNIFVYAPQSQPVQHHLLGILPMVLNINNLGIRVANLGSNVNAVKSVINRLQTTHRLPAITSFNVADRPSKWELNTEELRCSSLTTLPASGIVGQGTCLTDGLTRGIGAATTNDGWSYGCHSGCPNTGAQVHVIVQTRIYQTYPQGSQVFIHVNHGCATQIPVRLVLISRVQLKWIISYAIRNQSIRLEEVIIYTAGDPSDVVISVGNEPYMFSGNFIKTFKPLSDLSGTVVTYIIEGNDPQNQKRAIDVLGDRLKQNHGINHVTSINVAGYLSPWMLCPCCGFQTPLPPSPPSSTITPVVDQSSSTVTPAVDPGTPDVTFTSISTSYTSPTIPRNEPQADQQEGDNIPLVVGLVSLLVVVASAIAGIAFCLYKQKTKGSLTSGTSPSTDPNIYSESPTVTESNGITGDDPPPSYEEVEYEEAATVKPPVIPPRANRA